MLIHSEEERRRSCRPRCQRRIHFATVGREVPRLKMIHYVSYMKRSPLQGLTTGLLHSYYAVINAVVLLFSDETKIRFVRPQKIETHIASVDEMPFHPRLISR